MTEFKKYINLKKPLVGHEKVRYEMYKKAQEIADKFYPDDRIKNKVCRESYLLGMWDTLEIIYS